MADQNDINAYIFLEQAQQIATNLARTKEASKLLKILREVQEKIPNIVDLAAAGKVGNVPSSTAGKKEYEAFMRAAMQALGGSKRLSSLIEKVKYEQQWNGGYRRKSRKSNRRNKRRSYRY
jgi:hypothetical protein